MKKINDDNLNMIEKTGRYDDLWLERSKTPSLADGVPIEEFDKQFKKEEKLKLVSFDVDGYLVKTDGHLKELNIQIMDHVNKELKLPVEETEKALNDATPFGYFSTTKIPALEKKGVKTLKDQYNWFHDEYNFVARPYWKQEEVIKSIEFYGTWVDIIQRLAKIDITLAVASSRDLGFIVDVFEYNGIKKYFHDDLMFASLGGIECPNKPNTYMLDKISQISGVNPKNAVHGGDSPEDILMANKAGYLSMASTYGHLYNEEDVKKTNPDYIMADESEIDYFITIVESLQSKRR